MGSPKPLPFRNSEFEGLSTAWKIDFVYLLKQKQYKIIIPYSRQKIKTLFDESFGNLSLTLIPCFVPMAKAAVYYFTPNV